VIGTKHILMMTTAAALCATPMLAFGQQNTGSSSQMPTTTQSAPQQGAAGGAPTTGVGTAPTAQANPRDGTPGNPPSTATQRATDSVTGNRTDPDGTGNNPPGTAAGRALDRATGSDTTRATTAPDTTTGATTGMAAADSARITGGRRASKVIGSNVYNEQNESIGEVDDIIIPQGASQPVAIISVGGFLGIGARLVAIPYERLQHATDRDRWMLPGATKDSLKSLPAFTYEGDTVQPRG
jgi:hypothetical protein